MGSRLGIREAVGWVALGLAGALAIGAAAWLFVAGDDDEAPGASTAGSGLVASADGLGPLDSRGPELGQPAPDFALVDARDGTTIRRLSDYRGKTVVLNWFATWCGPCRSEMPDFETAYESLGGANGDVVFLLVNLQESSEQASEMLDEFNATYPAVLDATGSVANHYRILGMPTTFFIDPDGVIRSSGQGRVTEETLKRELAALGHRY